MRLSGINHVLSYGPPLCLHLYAPGFNKNKFYNDGPIEYFTNKVTVLLAIVKEQRNFSITLMFIQTRAYFVLMEDFKIKKKKTFHSKESNFLPT